MINNEPSAFFQMSYLKYEDSHQTDTVYSWIAAVVRIRSSSTLKEGDVIFLLDPNFNM